MLIPQKFLNRASVSLASADAHDLREIGYKNLSVAHLAGTRGMHDSFDDLVGPRIVDGNFYLGLRHEFHRVFGTAIDFGVPALTSEAAHLSDGDALHTDLAYSVADVIELERLDNRSNHFHCCTPLP